MLWRPDHFVRRFRVSNIRRDFQGLKFDGEKMFTDR